ncbi:uncharacterized protein LOC113790889 [Dermatophagoides pteronyssinus]|uniref:uncharacterized protein LOC113790889 n=1 Tax=Dermatophagoides pteronyssinus TaxID=6956 RepID=UPI003F6686CA
MFILFIWSGRFCYLYFIGNNRSFEWRVVNFDWINMAKIDNMLNIYIAVIGFISVYYAYILYFCNNNRVTQLIFLVLINGDQKFFINEKLLNQQKFVRQIRLWLNIYYQSFHLLYLVTYILAVIYEIQVMNFFMKNGYFSTCSGIISVITQSVQLIFVLIGSIILLDILFLFGSCFLSITMISFIKFEQIKKKCLKQNLKKSKIITKKFINEIRNRTIQMLLLTKSIDGTYGVLMFLFILTNGPINAYLTMIISIRTISFAERLLQQATIINQWSYIFVFHYIAIRFGHYLHLPSKYLINHYYKYSYLNCKINFRNRLQFSDWLEKFHTKQRYGLTYGRTNLITMTTFVRFILFYVKFTMIAYKLIRY